MVIYISLINTAAQSFIHFALFNDFTQGGSDRVSVHFAVTFLDCRRTSFCVTTIIRIVNNNTNDKQTSGISGVFIKVGGRITLNLIENVAVIRFFSYRTKILNFFNF